MRSEWIQQACYQALEELDIKQLEEEMVRLQGLEDSRESGVISPSLVSSQCALQRYKRFLGHEPWPGQPRRMNIKNGVPDMVTTLNFLRGFWGERMTLACLLHSLGDRVKAYAPTCRVDCEMELENGQVMKASGHPDCLAVGPDGHLTNIQIKFPSVYKLDRVEKEGEQEIWNSYLPQVATEMYICRGAGFPVTRGALLMGSWEGSATMRRPRFIAAEIEWEDSLAAFPERVAYELLDQLNAGTQPPALDDNKDNRRFPCGYCSFNPPWGAGDAPACNSDAWNGVGLPRGTAKVTA